jgi:hypothetical protein
VERDIRGHVTPGIIYLAKLEHLRHQVFQPFPVADVVDIFRRKTRSETFNDLANLVEFPDVLHRKPANDTAAPRLNDD